MPPCQPFRGIKPWLFLALLCLTSLSAFASDEPIPSPEHTPEKRFSFTFQDDFVSRYVWRGLALSEGPVMQPSLTASAYHFVAEVWTNFVLNDEPHQGRIDEVDPSLEYHIHVGDLEIVPMFEAYIFPGQGQPWTAEAQLKLSYAIGDLTLETSHNFDVVHSPGGYFGDLTVSYEKEIFKKFSWETSGGLGWANARFNRDNAGVSVAALNLFFWSTGVTWSPVDILSLSPHLDVNVLIDNDLRAAQADPTIVSGGLLVELSYP
jgi:hypothetical protein